MGLKQEVHAALACDHPGCGATFEAVYDDFLNLDKLPAGWWSRGEGAYGGPPTRHYCAQHELVIEVRDKAADAVPP